MSNRLTGNKAVSVHSQENIEAKIMSVAPNRKIKVFISSICGEEKYDRVRAQLKDAIEAMNLAEVYIFEGEGPSTLSAGVHYTWSLEDSDICIFLIDNADGITPGVQAEIDTVSKRNIKALYYFCDETSTEKTLLEQSLIGARFAKSKTVHKFDELSQNGAKGLLDDIIAIYHHYCAGRIFYRQDESDEEVQRVDIAGIENAQLPTIPKTLIQNVDKCRDYILNFVFGYPRGHYPDETEKTCGIDDWCAQFLPVLFEGKSIKHFNAAMFLDTLKAQQTDEHYQIVYGRWSAIQAYFLGDIEKCIEHLEATLKLAKETNQPTWMIKDILIDLRNQHWTLCTEKNTFTESPAQQELTESDEELYYPILDRIHDSLHEKYIEGLYKKKIESPYTVTIGNSFDQYGEMLASSYVVSMYNGSLTHILLFYNEIKDFVFYLCNKYDDWNFKLNLYKLALFAREEKQIQGIQRSYRNILNNLTAEDALSIISFCKNHPVEFKRESSELLAFGAIGYYLDDDNFDRYAMVLVDKIKTWLDDKNSVVSIGQSIIKCLSGVAYRMSQDTLGGICCQFFDRHYSRWYLEIFKFIADYIDLQKMSNESAYRLVDHIIKLLDNEKERDQVKNAPSFLYVLRKQDAKLTTKLDSKIAEYLPQYYEDIYKLNTTENKEEDMPVFIQKYTERIKKCNETQGKNGVYFGHGTRDIATVRTILLVEDVPIQAKIMDMLISTVADTLLVSKEDISTKLDAISLLICIVIKYPEDYKCNQGLYEKLFKYQDEIEADEESFMSSNIDSISLKIGLQFLNTAMKKNTYNNILELMPYIQDDIPTTIAVAKLIMKYLEVTDYVTLPSGINLIVLQNALQWLRSEHLDMRWYAARILLMLSRNPENHGLMNRQLVNLVDTEGAHIKNMIMRRIFKLDGITEQTKKYIIEKCKNDANFVVRMVCKETEEKNAIGNHKQKNL